jgi:hypothetical protein
MLFSQSLSLKKIIIWGLNQAYLMLEHWQKVSLSLFLPPIKNTTQKYETIVDAKDNTCVYYTIKKNLN